MYKLRQLKYKYYHIRSAYRKRRRLLFPSPAEVELIRIMGGKCIIVDHIKDPGTGFPLTIVTSMGTIFKRELIQRELQVGSKYLDFAVVTKYYRRGIEVDGRLWHQDITKEQERDEYLSQYGFTLLHIQAASIYREPARVQKLVLSFLSK